MIVRCPTCHVHFDDTFRWTYCPHDTFAVNDGSNHFTHYPESFRHAETCERVTHPHSLHPCDCHLAPAQQLSPPRTLRARLLRNLVWNAPLWGVVLTVGILMPPAVGTLVSLAIVAANVLGFLEGRWGPRYFQQPGSAPAVRRP